MKDTDTIASSNIIDPGSAISTSSDNLSPSGVKINIEDLINMPRQCLEHLTTADIPDLAGPVNTASSTELTRKLELGTGNFSLMVF